MVFYDPLADGKSKSATREPGFPVKSFKRSEDSLGMVGMKSYAIIGRL